MPDAPAMDAPGEIPLGNLFIPDPVDNSSFMGDLRAGGLQMQQFLPAVRAAGDLNAIGSITSDLEYERLIAEEAAAQIASLQEELSNIPDDDARRAVLDQIVELQARVDRYQMTTPSLEARDAALVERRDEAMDGFASEALQIMGLNRQIAEIPMNPSAREVGEAETWGDVFSAVGDDPLGVIRTFGVRSLPASAPSIVGAVAGQFIGGPVGAAMLSGTAGGATEMGMSVAQGISEQLMEGGVNVMDDAAVEEFIRTNPEAFGEVVQTAMIRAGVISSADAATAGLVGKIAQGVRNAPRMTRAGTVLGTGLVVEPTGEALGEAGAMLASGQEFKPGEVAAEALGAMGQGVVQTGGQTVAEGMRASPQDQAIRDFGRSIDQAQPVQNPIDAAIQLLRTPQQVSTAQDLPPVRPTPETPAVYPVMRQPEVIVEAGEEEPPSPDTAAPEAVDAPRVADVVKAPPAPRKRPFTNIVKRSGIKIDPNGPVGRELAANGITPRNTIGLFANGGLKSVDNLPASEHPEMRELLGFQDDGTYLDQQSIIDALVTEFSGTPIQGAEEMARQAAWDEYNEVSSEIYQEYQEDTENVDEGARVIPSPDVDIQTGTERIGSIQKAVRDTVQEYNLASVVTDEDIGYIVGELDERGGDVLAALENFVVRSVLNAEQDEQVAAPGIAEAEGIPDFTGPVSNALPAERGAEGPVDTGRIGEFETEQTPEGEQAVVPGSREDGPTEADVRAQHEAEVRAQQSKMRRTGQEGVDTQEGGLFATPQDDLFNQEPVKKETVENQEVTPEGPETETAGQEEITVVSTRQTRSISEGAVTYVKLSDGREIPISRQEPGSSFGLGGWWRDDVSPNAGNVGDGYLAATKKEAIQRLLEIENGRAKVKLKSVEDSGSVADAGDYGPKPGKRPAGRLSPRFVKFSFNNKPSVYNSAFRDAGVDPDTARQKDLGWQLQTLKTIFEDRYGIKVEIGTFKTTRRNIVGRKVEVQKPDLQIRKALDQLLDAYQTLEMLAAVMNVPVRMLALEIDGKPITLNLTSTKRLKGALGMFSWGGGKRVIHMPGRSNSFAHEWGHALDHWLTTQVEHPSMKEMLTREMSVPEGRLQPNVSFTHKGRQITDAMTAVLIALFGQNPAIGGIRLRLNVLAAQVDADGNPTPSAKEAQKALDAAKAGGAIAKKYLSDYSVSSKEYDEAVAAGGYFTDPAEMFARAFEAWVGRTVAKMTDAPQNFLSKGAWAYEDGNDARNALTFPKGVDADWFGVAMARLSVAMRDTASVEEGGPAFPRNPERVEPMLIKRKPPEGTWLGRWYKSEVANLKNSVSSILTAVGLKKENLPETEERLTRSFMRHVVNSTAGALHDIARSYTGEARKAIDNIALKIGKRPGYGQFTGNVWQEEMEAYALAKLNYVRREVKNVFPSGEIPADLRRPLRHALLGNDTVDGEPIPPVIKALARKLNQVTDDIWYDLDSAGMNPGYQRGYLPFVYHLGKIDAKQEGFKAKAKQVYSLMFEREVMGQENLSDEQVADINRAIRVLDGDEKQEWWGTTTPRSWLSDDNMEMIEDWRKMRRQVKDLARRAEKAKDPDKAAELLAKMEEVQEQLDELHLDLLDMLQDRWSDYSVEHWFVAQGVGQINDFDTMGPTANFLKERRFPPEAADILEDFMVSDPLELLQGYIFGASRKIQYAKAFGKPTQTDDGDMIGADLKTMLEAARSAGVTAQDIETIKTAVNAATGRMRGDVRGWLRMIGRINAYGQMSLLTLAPLSSFAEPLTIGLRTGSVRDAGVALISNLRNVVQKGRRRDLYDLAAFIGMVSDYTAETVMSNRMSMDAMSLTDKDRARVAKFHQMTGLTPLTNFGRVANLPVADGVIRRLLRHSVRGQRTLANAARDTISGGFGKFADQELNELGIDARDREHLLNWLESLDGMPRQEDMIGPNGSMHDAARIWARAVRRMTNETIQNTLKSDRAIAANNPFLASMYSIMSFIDGFHRNVLLRTLHRGVSEDAGTVSWERLSKGAANVALAAVPAGTLFAGQLLVTIVREMLLNAERVEDMDDDELYDYMLARAWSRTGLTGRFDPLIQIATGVKYENDLTGLIAGPYNSFFMGQYQTMFEAIWGRNSPNTNTTEWNAAQSIYRGLVHPLGAAAVTTFLPASGAAGLFGSSALYYLGRYDTSREFADTAAGPKGTNYSKEGIDPLWWEMGDAKWREDDE